VAQTPTAPQGIWLRTQDGGAVHQQSKLACPALARGFRLTEVIANDRFGLDVGCSYESADADRIALSFTRTRGDYGFAANLEVSAFSVYFENAAIQTAREELPQFEPQQTWLGAFYRYGETSRRTGVWLTDLLGWTLKYRADFDVARQPEMLATLLALTAKARASTGPHLARCAALPSPERNGVRISDAMRVKALAGAAGTAMARPPAGAVWCAEQGINDAMGPFLYLREASNGRDRLAWVAIDDPPVFDIVLQAPSQQDGAAAVYRLESPFEGRILIFGFFEGRPAVELLMPAVRSSFIGALPVGVFDTRTGRMQIR
jgi:hypothetical protein